MDVEVDRDVGLALAGIGRSPGDVHDAKCSSIGETRSPRLRISFGPMARLLAKPSAMSCPALVVVLARHGCRVGEAAMNSRV